MSDARVVITGAGVVSPLGGTLTELWRGLEDGESAVRPLSRFDASRFACRIAAEVSPSVCPPAEGPYAHEVRRGGKFVHFAVAAAERAASDGRLRLDGEAAASCALYLGVSTGGLDEMENAVIRQETRGARKVSPYQITSMLPNMAAGLIALRNDFTGPQYTISGACASGSQAIGQAFHAIRSRVVDCALAGGADGVLTPIAFSSFQAMRMLSTRNGGRPTPRPFDCDSDGIVLGEGAVVFCLEERERAVRRGARIYAEIEGYATCSGGGGVALPSTSDTLRCLRLALADARRDSADVDCVYAQAAGVRKGDESELDALQALFAAGRARPAVTSIKGHLGHTFAASGPLNLAAAVGALNGRKISPTLNLEAVAPQYSGMNLFPDYGAGAVRRCLINTYGFGGVGAALVVAQPFHGSPVPEAKEI
ncbi:MAG TPA: beta-ketoacyl-[acyl-carrier-protein] synthase family protein [Thermoanaerobaculia bacterium]|nr:beta-ketoacyl-[acyl-carrier-protein] synthase family protein [Thermoanaerobaculia bacterium]